MAAESSFEMGELTQAHIDEYVADTDQFWPAYHAGLQAPYAIYKQYRSTPAEEFYQLCSNSNEDIHMINTLKDFPVLKGEFPVAVASGDILTNYRYVVTEVGSATNIPLHVLTHYDIQSSSSDTRNDLVIKYHRNGSEQTMRLDAWVKDEIVRAVRDAGEYNDLNEIQKKILEQSSYNIKRKHPAMNIPEIAMYVFPEEPCFEGMGCYKLPLPDGMKGVLRQIDKAMT